MAFRRCASVGDLRWNPIFQKIAKVMADGCIGLSPAMGMIEEFLKLIEDKHRGKRKIIGAPNLHVLTVQIPPQVLVIPSRRVVGASASKLLLEPRGGLLQRGTRGFVGEVNVEVNREVVLLAE